ncbi:RecB family nuclease, TM0106, putative [Oxalobacteraceae bacterium]
MRRINSQTFFSPSDLAEFAACRHATSLNLVNLDTDLKKTEADETLKILQDHGDIHEKNYLARLKQEGRQVVEIPAKLPQPDRHRLTLQAMQQGAEVVFQAALEVGPFRGYADFLLKVDRPSSLGEFSYEVADTKLASSGKARHLVQIALYSDMVEVVQGLAPASASLEFGSGKSKSYRLDAYRHYVRRLKSRFLDFVSQRPTTTPEKCEHCNFCSWKDLCTEDWRNQDHLNQVARISAPQIRRLREAGIKTMAELAQASDAVPGMSSFETLRKQASLQVHKRATDEDKVELKVPDPLGYGGFYRLPNPDEGDLYFDMEGYPYEKGGLEYLFGVSYWQSGELVFKPFWGHDRQGEKKAFEEFIDFVSERLRLYPNLHIYHYADYERRALHTLMQTHGVREKEVDQILREQRLVDLYTVVRESIMTSEPRYSIKNLETFYMKGERESDVKNAGASIVFYEAWRNDKNQKWLDDIERYNEEDCISTQKLHDWLIGLRSKAELEFSVTFPWYVAGGNADDTSKASSERSDAVLAAIAKKNTVREHIETYLQPFTEQDRKDGSALSVQTLLYLLDFYWREAKPTFWKMFDQQKDSVEKLLDDMDAIAGLELDSEVAPVRDKQSMIYRYYMPRQDHRLKVGDSIRDTFSLKSIGTLHWLDADAGQLEIRIGTRTINSHWDGDMPTQCSIASINSVNTDKLDTAIVRFASSRFDANPSGGYDALWHVLDQAFPRLAGHQRGSPILSDATSTERVIDVVSRLDNSYLVIQGPPGTGKTYTGARVILALLAQGKRVGISALSHQAIANFLDAVNEAAIESNKKYLGSRKSDGDTPLKSNQFIQDVGDSEEALDDKYRLVAGTAWLFARESADQAFDYLFIDEAGQTSLANLVAMGTAAKNLVFLGDQMQLGQPLQGQHPGDAGLSALEYLLRDNATVPPTLGVLLNQTWRMHPDVCSFISQALYDGRLTNQVDTAKQKIVLNSSADPALKASGIVFESVAHEGCAQTSEAEASRINELVTSLLKQTYIDSKGKSHPFTVGDILVVAPYNAQVRVLKQQLPENLKIGTVDKFQGMEAEVVIVSMTTSSGDDMPRDMSFLFDRRRLNVAVSRAKTLAIIVACPRLLDVDCKTPEQMALADTLCWAAELGIVKNGRSKNLSAKKVDKPWLSDEYDMPVLENEEMWAQRVIDESDE